MDKPNQPNKPKKIEQKKVDTKKTESKKPDPKKTIFTLGKLNINLILIGLGVLSLGFILLIGGGSSNPNVFSPAIFDFQHLTLAPLLIAAGFMIQIVAIMIIPKENKPKQQDTITSNH